VENINGKWEETVHRWGKATASTSYERTSRLQIQAPKKT